MKVRRILSCSVMGKKAMASMMICVPTLTWEHLGVLPVELEMVGGELEV